METSMRSIVLDFSHGSAADLDFAVVWFAHKQGWDGGVNDINQLVADWDDYEHGETPSDYSDDEDFHFSYREALYSACEDAVDWMNDNATNGCHYYIDDNCLYMEENDG